MAVKTITIDMEAYEALKRRKGEGQSFSQVIKQHFRPRGTGQDLLDAFGTFGVSEETLDEIEEVIRERQNDRPRDIDL